MNVERQQRTLAIVADDLRLAQFVSNVAGRAGWRTMSHRRTDDGVAAMLAGRTGIEAVLIDQEQPEDNACQLVREIRAAHPQLPLLVATRSRPAAIGTELVRAGATDFLSKPLERDRIVRSLRLATGREATPGELQPLSEELRIPQRFEDMIGTEEINRLPLANQERLAAAIASSRIKPLGSPHSFLIDVRILAATSLPVSQLIERGELSPALHEALDPVDITLPP